MIWFVSKFPLFAYLKLGADWLPHQVRYTIRVSLLALSVSLFLSACGGSYAESNSSDLAINAANVSNKGQYKELAERRNKQPVTFDVYENVAYMQGVMDSTIPHLVRNLISNYPAVNTIVMTNALGTIDFEATWGTGAGAKTLTLTHVMVDR